MKTPVTSTRRPAIVAVTAGLLAGGTIGLVGTVPSLTSAAAPLLEQDDTVEEPDSDTGDEIGESEPGEKIRELLDELVADGTISDEQADAVTQHLIDNAPARGEWGRGHRRPGFEARTPGFQDRTPSFQARTPDVQLSGELASLLGFDEPQDLGEALRDGQTIAELAAANGVSSDEVADLLISLAEDRLDQAVDDERIDQETADEQLERVSERVDDLLNRLLPDDNGDSDADETRETPDAEGA